MKTAPNRGHRAADNRRPAFTLVELLVVIVIIGLVATLLLPVLAGAKARSKQSSCLANLRQLEIAFQMYANDNAGYLVQNAAFAVTSESVIGTNAWVGGNVKNTTDATNALRIKSGELFPYIAQTMSYRCPADSIVDSGPLRLRSYSMNSWVGSTQMQLKEGQTPFRTFIKDNDLAAAMPSAIWVIMDEHTLTLDDGCFIVTMDDSEPFENVPATHHQNAYGLNFADGHAEIYHLRTAATQIPETQAQAFAQITASNLAALSDPKNLDWIKLKGITTSR